MKTEWDQNYLKTEWDKNHLKTEWDKNYLKAEWDKIVRYQKKGVQPALSPDPRCGEKNA